MFKWLRKIMCELYMHRWTQYVVGGVLYRRCKDCEEIQESVESMSKGVLIPEWRTVWVIVGGLNHLHNQMDRIDKHHRDIEDIHF